VCNSLPFLISVIRRLTAASYSLPRIPPVKWSVQQPFRRSITPLADPSKGAHHLLQCHPVDFSSSLLRYFRSFWFPNSCFDIFRCWAVQSECTTYPRIIKPGADFLSMEAPCRPQRVSYLSHDKYEYPNLFLHVSYYAVPGLKCRGRTPHLTLPISLKTFHESSPETTALSDCACDPRFSGLRVLVTRKDK